MYNANKKKEETLPSVDVIVVNYGKGWLRRCLTSVAHTQYPLSQLKIIVVDNASNDKDLQLIESTFSGVRLLRLEKNVGYPMAVNIGAERSAGEYIAVLNNDVIVPPRWLAELTDVLERDGTVGAISPRKKSLYMKQTLDGCGGAFNILGQGWDRGQYETDIGQYSSLDEVVNPSGAIFLTRRKLMNEFGFLLNPDFFMVLDDLDFGLRCWKAGYRVLYSPTCVVYHARGPSLGGLSEHKNLYFYSRNMLASMFEVFDLSFFIRLFPILIAAQFMQALYLLFFHRKSHAVPSVFRGVVDFLLNLRVYGRRRATMRMAFKKGDKTLVERFTPTLAVFEESKNHKSLILAFLSAINLYVRLFLRVQPIRDIVYIRKTPK
jgi:GT2 family glycosyltransferase